MSCVHSVVVGKLALSLILCGWKKESKDIHRVLKPTGSIFLPCDYHANHRLRVMLDDPFGENNFVNGITLAL